jgi:pyruvate,orthophosphate dikinase
MLSIRGGKTSHVAVVARGLGKPLVCGVENLSIDFENKMLFYKTKKFYEGNIITIDGTLGLIVSGRCNLIEPESNAYLTKILSMTEKIPTIRIRANADTPQMAMDALKYGAKGIGLCRIEHLYNSNIILELMKARSSEERRKILEKIKPIQKEGFKKIFEIVKGLPITIRLFDPPLSKFLPDISQIKAEVMLLKFRLKNGDLVRKQLKDAEEMQNLIQNQIETNPDLGLRGCRIDIKWPEINQTMCYALFEAAIEVIQEGIPVNLEILIPLVSYVSELKFVKENILSIANKLSKQYGISLPFKIGNIIETPRSALIAEEFAQNVDFLSFGTNDLTQMTLGFSRDDTEGKFLPKYLERGITKSNPFEIIDEEGPGKLIKIATEKARRVKPDIELGISGEHGGNPESIDIFYKMGLDYVSCSPFRIPTARIAAAQSYIRNKLKNG